MAEGPIPDDEHGADLPMNMTASVMLTGLPRDAHQALADVEAIDAGKSELLYLKSLHFFIVLTHHATSHGTRTSLVRSDR